MPIKGISEKKRLPRLGKIHLGVKKTKIVNGREVAYPSAVDHFVCPPEVQAVFGEKPRELRILIPVEDEERWCSQYYRCYSRTRGLVCKGDGETCLRMVDASTGALADHDSKEVVLKELPCRGRDCPDYEQQCREIMNLQFLLPEVPGLGVWQIDTSSINSIRNINSAADLVKRIYGRISMIPLLLTIEPQEVQDSEGKRRTVNVLNLRTNQTLLQMMETIAKPTPEMLAAGQIELPEPDDEVPEMVIPQAQEEKVTASVEPEKTPPARPKLEPPVEAQAPPTEAEAALATPQDKRELVKRMREKGMTDEEMREMMQRVTGKKGAWTKADLAKVEQELKKEPRSADDEVDEFLKEFGG